jgi:hypothetical protein
MNQGNNLVFTLLDAIGKITKAYYMIITISKSCRRYLQAMKKYMPGL